MKFDEDKIAFALEVDREKIHPSATLLAVSGHYSYPMEAGTILEVQFTDGHLYAGSLVAVFPSFDLATAKAVQMEQARKVSNFLRYRFILC